MPKFRKKPVVIEAVRWAPSDTGMKRDEEREFFGFMRADPQPDWRTEGLGAKCTVILATLEGEMTVSPGDWIIRGVQGEVYPCKPDIFDATYEQVDDAG
jgi:hypothetical protein